MNKRRCVFLDCPSVAGEQRLYSFPTHNPDLCRLWVRRSGNPWLAELPLESLKEKRFCEKHFSPKAFKSPARRYIYANAFPIYTADGQLLEGVDKSDMEGWVPQLTRRIRSGTSGKGQLPVRTPNTDKKLQASLKLKKVSISGNAITSRKKQCAFAGCDSVNDAQHLYSFPVHEPDVCRIWARRTGNPTLETLPLAYLKHKYACEKHFSTNSFVSSARTCLRSNVRPVYAADGQLLEGVNEFEAQRRYPKQKYITSALNALKARRRKAIAQSILSSAAKTPESKLPKMFENTEAVSSRECVPVPAGTMLGKMYSGNMSDVCSLCLCEDGKLLRSTNVFLKDDYTEGNFSLASLVRELQLDKIIAQNSLDRLCELCVQQLSLFYLFKSKCTKLASGLTNFYTFTETTKDNTTVVLPFETIQEYAVKDENLGYLEAKMEIEDSSYEERLVDQSNLDAIPIHTSTNEQYSVRVLNGGHYLNKDQLKSSMDVKLKKSIFTRQSELNKYKTVTKCIVQGMSYCSCCLTENQELFEVHETMLFMEGQNEIVPLKDILFGIIYNKTTGRVPTVICQDCLNDTINACNFKTMFHKSTSIIRNCISCFETCLTNTESIDLLEEAINMHLNFYEQFNDFISPIHSKLRSNSNPYSVATKVIKPNTKQEVSPDKIEVSVTDRSVEKSEELTTACHICGQEFSSLDKVQLHITAKHNDLLYCSYCNKHYKSKPLLRNHIAKCQTIEAPFECDLCNRKFSKRAIIDAHRLCHFPKTIKCDYCHIMFWKGIDLKHHILHTHRELLQPNYECSICHSVFFKRKEIREHNLHTHRELLQPSHECSICHSVFFKKKEMSEHKATHPPDAMHTCKYCGASYKKLNSYYAHNCPGKVMSLKTTNVIENKDNSNIKCDVQTMKNYESHSTICDICGVVLKNHKSIKMHRKSHEEIKEKRDSTKKQKKSKCNKMAMCQLCGRLLKDKLSLDRHIKTSCKITTGQQCHIGPDGIKEKPVRKVKIIECQQCNYKTKAKSCMEHHINKHHLKIKPYKCSVCEKNYFTAFLLKVHKQIHTHKKDIKCNECGEKFKYKISLKYHTRIHTGEKPYPCDLCDEKFLSASRRLNHRTRRHFEPTVQCKICLKFCYFHSSLREHIRKCHSGDSKKKRNERKSQKNKQCSD